MIDPQIASIVLGAAFFAGNHVVKLIAEIHPSWGSSWHAKRINNVMAGFITVAAAIYQLALGTLAGGALLAFLTATYALVFGAVDAGYRSKQGLTRKTEGDKWKEARTAELEVEPEPLPPVVRSQDMPTQYQPAPAPAPAAAVTPAYEQPPTPTREELEAAHARAQAQLNAQELVVNAPMM